MHGLKWPIKTAGSVQTDELGTLERLSRTVATLQDRSDYMTRTLDSRLAELEVKGQAAAANAEGKANEA